MTHTKDESLKLALDDLMVEYDMERTSFAKRVDEIFKQVTPEQPSPVTSLQALALDKMAENARELGLDYEPAHVQPVATLFGSLPVYDTTPPAQPAPVQEPVAWLYPEGLEALKAGKCWTAYGTKQDDNCNILVYLAAVAQKVEPVKTECDGFDSHPAAQRTEQELVAHCEAGPEFCPVCRAETRSLALAAAVGYIQRNTPPFVWTEICNALTTTPPTAPVQPAELDATNRQVEILSDALAESRREVAALKAVQEPAAWQERQARRMSHGVVTEWTNWYPCRHRTIDEAREEASDHIPYEWRPLYTTPPAAQPAPVKDEFELRGTLASLKCWHRLTEEEADDLVRFAAAHVQAPVGYRFVPVTPTREIEDAIGRARNLSASEIWEDALAAVPTPPAALRTEQEPSQREFENWLRSKWTAGYACQKLEGRYTDKAAQSFWECWQAAHGIKENT